MKIKLAILENDEIYLNRLKTTFDVKYSDKLETYLFTDREIALKTVNEKKIDVFLANVSFDIKESDIFPNCGFAYLVENMDVETVNGHVAICKFQKAENIYRQILGIFSEKTTTGLRMDENAAKILVFTSAGGGVGNSVVAAACAMNYAQKGKRTLYLNLEKFGSADVFFHADGNTSLGDVIYAIKSKKGNLALKLESAVKRDASGVCFFSSTKMALDIAELNLSELLQIIHTLRSSGLYDYMILDMDFTLEKAFLEILENCNLIIWVADGSTTSNTKIERAVASVNVMEQQTGMKILLKSGILYNRFSSQTSQKVKGIELKEFGGINRYEGYNVEKLLKQLSTHAIFDAIEREINER